MTKLELIEKLKAKAASATDGAKGSPAAPKKPTAGIPAGSNPQTPPAVATSPGKDATQAGTPAVKEGEQAGPQAAGGESDVLTALQELSSKLDMIGEALATILEGKAAPADDETTSDKEGEIEPGDEAREGTDGEEDEELDEEEEEELEKIAQEMDRISNENGPAEQE